MHNIAIPNAAISVGIPFDVTEPSIMEEFLDEYLLDEPFFALELVMSTIA
jgi:hypothetical protein